MDLDEEDCLQQQVDLFNLSEWSSSAINKGANYLRQTVDHRLFTSKSNLTAEDKKDPAYAHVTHKNHVSLTKYKAFSNQQIEADLTECCSCGNQCQEQLDIQTVLRWRKKVHTLIQGEQQQQKLLELYQETLFNDGRLKTTHIVEGKIVCKETWYKTVLRISLSSYKRVRQIAKQGLTSVVGKERGRICERGEIALGFMKWYLSVTGDHSPENQRILLPVGVTVQDIFTEYKRVYSHDTTLEKSSFYNIWKHNFPNVTHQQHCRFSKCNVCVMAKQLLQQNLSPNVHVKVLRDREEHLLRQQREREAYYVRRAEAISYPTEKQSTIVDGMDQSKTNLPHFQGWNNPKMCTSSNMLQTHVNGVLIHGLKTYMFVDLHQWPHDSNLTLNCLLQSLVDANHGGQLPKTLYIQLDNCGRENKNKYFLGTVALLIKLHFVKEVILSFLMVGHTHEDIDSRFSRIACNLKRKTAYTVPDLLQVINSSLKSGMEARLVTQVYNIRDWLAPVLTDIHNHQLPHVYRFFEDRPGHVTVHYKNWSTDAEWLPKPTDGPLEIFQLDAEGHQQLPEGTPSLVAPDITRNAKKQNLEAIKQNIENLKKCLTANQYAWWQSFFHNPNLVENEDIRNWYLEDIQKYHSSQHGQGQRVSNESIESPLSILMEKERSIPTVFIGNKRKLNNVTSGQTTTQKVQCEEGVMILFKLKNEFGVGSVISISPEEYVVRKFRGPLNGVWEPVQQKPGKFVEVAIPKTALIEDGIFVLTSHRKLPSTMKKIVKTHM